MTDPLDTLARLGADITSSPGARRAAEQRLRTAITDERMGFRPSWTTALRRPQLLPAFAVVLAVVVAAVLVVSARPDRETPPSPKSTAAAARVALDKSRRLTAAPALPRLQAPSTPRLTPRTADELAERLARTVPYPPGVRDDLRPLLSQARPDMSRVTDASDGERLAQYRAWCSWMGYWLNQRSLGDAMAIRAARTVLADAQRWPAFRRNPRVQRNIAQATRSDDIGPIAYQVQLNCQGVP